MTAESRFFGTTARGEAVQAYTLENSSGMRATVIDYGAALQSLLVPNRQGGLTDVVLGFDDVAGYEGQDAYIGATIGRMANRVGGAAFSLGGHRYSLFANDGANHLHGGQRGFDKFVWQAAQGEDFVCFSRLSPDGEEGYPGNLQVSVTYRLTEDKALCIRYEAVCDRDTVVSLTNHSYFNLSGGGSVLEQQLQINAQRYSELGAGMLPTGKALPVEGSPFDFRSLKPIGQDIEAEHPQLALGGGYDHNFILSGPVAAIARSWESGIKLQCETDLPGMQLYTANFLGNFTGKGGAAMGRRQAFCLETQLFPNAMNCYGFPSPVLRAGERMAHETRYKFSLFEVE
ncbi:MAG: aldose epimerase family protein [Candidatus Limivicinus sp.]